MKVTTTEKIEVWVIKASDFEWHCIRSTSDLGASGYKPGFLQIESVDSHEAIVRDFVEMYSQSHLAGHARASKLIKLIARAKLLLEADGEKP